MLRLPLREAVSIFAASFQTPVFISASVAIIFIFIIAMIVVRYKLNLPVWNTPKL